MKKNEFFIDNVKCGGCENTVRKALLSFPELREPGVDFKEGKVWFEAPEEFEIQPVKDKLRSLGYPEAGSLSGLAETAAFARSFVSCAVGKLTADSAEA